MGCSCGIGLKGCSFFCCVDLTLALIYTLDIALTENKREKIQASSPLAKECHAMKLDLLTNAAVVDDTIRFIEEKSSNLKNDMQLSNTMKLNEGKKQ
jgi:hypothetical protein